MQVVEVADLGHHAPAWDELVAAMSLPSPFLRSWWLAAVDEGSGAYVLVLDGDRLVGGIPLTRRDLPGIALYTFVGHGILCPDHMDVVAAPGQLPAVSDALAGWARDGGNRLFDLAGIAETSRIASWLPHARADARESAPWTELPASYDEYLDTRSKSFKKTWRRAQNRFDRLGATVRAVGADDLDSALAEFERLHRERGDRQELVAELPRLNKGLAAGVRAGEV